MTDAPSLSVLPGWLLLGGLGLWIGALWVGLALAALGRPTLIGSGSGVALRLLDFGRVLGRRITRTDPDPDPVLLDHHNGGDAR